MSKQKWFYKFRRALTLGVTTILLLGGTGCMGEILFNQMQNWNKDLRQQALDYMEEKYGEKFSLFQYAGENGGLVDVYPGTATTIDVVPESHPEWLVTVNYNPEYKGVLFADNYVAFLLGDGMRDIIYPYVVQVYGTEGTFKAYEPGMAPIENEYNRNSTAEEYLLNYSHEFEYMTSQDASNKDEDAKALWDVLKESPYSVSVRIRYVEKDSEGVWDYLCSGNISCYTHNKQNGFEPVIWVEGKANG